ncbi:hypothetical protein [Aquiflexum sp.]|uniref:hypothetical protein n=1 Tax=Aquiflexum sp. TaxID=1872584 RepID=UPI00359475B6
MKIAKILLLCLFVIFAFSSCDKEDPRPNYYYKFKVNGVEKEFKANNDANIVFIEDTNSSNRFTIFTFITGSDPNKNAIIISLRTTVSPEFGVNYTMQNPIVVNEQTAPSLTFIYLDENGKEYGATLLQSRNPGAMDDGSLMLTELSAEGSYGTFQAVTFDLNSTGELSQRQSLILTDGEFFMPNVVSLR